MGAGQRRRRPQHLAQRPPLRPAAAAARGHLLLLLPVRAVARPAPPFTAHIPTPRYVPFLRIPQAVHTASCSLALLISPRRHPAPSHTPVPPRAPRPARPGPRPLRRRTARRALAEYAARLAFNVTVPPGYDEAPQPAPSSPCRCAPPDPPRGGRAGGAGRGRAAGAPKAEL